LSTTWYASARRPFDRPCGGLAGDAATPCGHGREQVGQSGQKATVVVSGYNTPSLSPTVGEGDGIPWAFEDSANLLFGLLDQP